MDSQIELLTVRGLPGQRAVEWTEPDGSRAKIELLDHIIDGDAYILTIYQPGASESHLPALNQRSDFPGIYLNAGVSPANIREDLARAMDELFRYFRAARSARGTIDGETFESEQANPTKGRPPKAYWAY